MIQKKKPPSESTGWRETEPSPSISGMHKTLKVPQKAGFIRKWFAFMGPGFLVAVGYMDPGNWATDLAGGSMFHYSLLSVIFISNLVAIVLQSLCARLGIATGRDLAQACRDHFSKSVNIALWILCELAIAACDLAEIIGSAIALQLLFQLPLIYGVGITSLDIMLILALQNKGFRYIEAIVISLITIIAICFGFELVFSKPHIADVLGGLIPSVELIHNPQMLYIGLGILGATVMPHNLYLHSSIVQTRNYEESIAGKRTALRFATLDSTVALMMALFINAAILILSGATFYESGHHEVAEIADAYQLLNPLLGTGFASLLFAIALLASGQSSTLTGTLAGQIVMEGFLDIRLRPWLRRLITRMMAIIPAILVIYLYGEKAIGELLVLSQVILSLQLSFAVIPLVMFTTNPKKMGEFVAPVWLRFVSWFIAISIAGLNIYLLYGTFLT
ncbi:MAG TPA: Nramp family divalent metal transporter [Bacillota bacterium]|nr:Nramp family divalent metal transporter [Bacillota bacterium]